MDAHEGGWYGRIQICKYADMQGDWDRMMKTGLATLRAKRLSVSTSQSLSLFEFNLFAILIESAPNVTSSSFIPGVQDISSSTEAFPSCLFLCDTNLAAKMSTAASAPIPVYKHSSNTDYSNSLVVLTTVILALGTIAVLAQIYARNFASKVPFGFDDALAYIAWVCGLSSYVKVVTNQLIGK